MTVLYFMLEKLKALAETSCMVEGRDWRGEGGVRGQNPYTVLPPDVDQLLLLLHLPCFVDTGLRPDVAELMMARLSNCPSVAPSFPPRQRVVLPPARIPPANPAVSQSVSQHPRQRAQRDPGLGGTTQHIQECHNTPTTTVTAATARDRGRH